MINLLIKHFVVARNLFAIDFLFKLNKQKLLMSLNMELSQVVGNINFYVQFARKTQ